MRLNTTAIDTAMQLERPLMLTPAQVAKTGIMSLYAVRKGIADNSIPFVKIGSHYRINYTKLLQQFRDC